MRSARALAHHLARALLKEAVEDFWHVDSRLWRSLRALVVKPGFLTVEFLAGRRAR